jgi:DNA-binding NarL/FixJ family response regulator
MKILLLDDHALFRAGLRLLLTTFNSSHIILEAGTTANALEIAAQHPDLELCLLDLNLRNEIGLLALDKIKTAIPEIAVVIVSSSEDAVLIRKCLDAGAMSYISKSSPPEELSQAIQQVLGGSVYLPPTMYSEVNDVVNPSIVLSPRQRDVLLGLCRGLPTKSIARELGLSDYTVKEYVSAVFQLLSVHNRTEAVIKASQMHLFTAER